MLKLIAFARLRLEDITAELDLDKNRKKSHNMILATSVIESLFKGVNPEFKSRLDIIFCSGEGEIAQTFDYFKNLSEGRARPILFQNSLHNSTLGALSLEVSNLASGITVSHGDISFESAIDVALSSPSHLPQLIVGVDAYNEEIKRLRTEAFGPGTKLENGACAGLFIPDTHPSFHKASGPIIRDITFEPNAEKPACEHFYPANGLEVIHPGLSAQKTFSYVRPSGTKVTVHTYEN